MADGITITSTTDSEADVRAALGMAPAKAASETPVDAKSTPEAAPDSAPDAEAETPKAKPAEKVDAKADEHDDDTPTDAEASEAGAKLAKLAKKSRLQTRINELVRDKSTTQRERDEARRELAAAREQLAALQKDLKTAPPAEPDKAAPAAVKEEPGEEPKEDDFPTYGEYLKALTKHHADAAVRSARQQWETERENERRQAQAEAAKADIERRRKAFQDREAKAAERYADYFDVKEKSKDLEIGETVLDYLNESEIGPDLIYYFANNPDEAAQLASLSPRNALLALGRLEARHQAGTLNTASSDENDDEADDSAQETPEAPEPKKRIPVSGAPEPTPVLKSSVTTPEKDPNKMSFQEFKAWRNAGRTSRGAHASR